MYAISRSNYMLMRFRDQTDFVQVQQRIGSIKTLQAQAFP
jgi:hypothetical protein